MLDRLLGLTGLLVMLIAAVWAVAGGPSAPVGILTAVGLILVIANALVWRRTGPDLAVPEGTVLPSPPWGLLVGPAGALGLVAATLSGAAALAIASGLVLAAALPGLVRRFPSDAVPLRVVSSAGSIRKFVEAHGAEPGAAVTGYSAPVGEGGTRLVVIAPDGEWGDVMVPVETAETVAALARVELTASSDPTTGGRLRITAPFWKSMMRSW